MTQSVPTRRSSDLVVCLHVEQWGEWIRHHSFAMVEHLVHVKQGFCGALTVRNNRRIRIEQRSKSLCFILLCVLVLELVSLCSRSEEHTSELQSLMCISYAVFCLKKKYNYLY